MCNVFYCIFYIEYRVLKFLYYTIYVSSKYWDKHIEL